MRIVVNVASDSWVKGQVRLKEALCYADENIISWTNQLPNGSPPHRAMGSMGGEAAECVPYAFKAYALKHVSQDFQTLLWCDACIVPIKPLDELWERIERDGYWIGKSGYTNYEWTADSAYPDLFAEGFNLSRAVDPYGLKIGTDDEWSAAVWRNVWRANRRIPHVVATAFGISLAHPTGRAILDEYYRLASTTKAFCGPWQNARSPRVPGRNTDHLSAPCGPPDVLGHRHDQTALSVIAWRLGCELTSSPEIFAYGKASEVDYPDDRRASLERTVLLADGGY